MEPEFWLERWRQGKTGFHQTRVTPLLAKYWPRLGLPAGSRVLVPLCGKTIDMIWLAEQGHQVLGVELSPLAIEQFFEEHGLTPEQHESSEGVHYRSGPIEVICGDIFGLRSETLAACTGVYDRAALVALPPSMRQRYADVVYGGLPHGYRGLLLTLDYNQQQMDGPPFAVNEAEVMRLFHTGTRVQCIDNRPILDKEPKFKEKGLDRLDTLVFDLTGDRP